MSRIVLDTNSLIQSIPPKSIYHAIWQSFLDGTNTLCVSTEILAQRAIHPLRPRVDVLMLRLEWQERSNLQ